MIGIANDNPPAVLSTLAGFRGTRKRDSQRSKLYRWEREQLEGILLADLPQHNRELSLAECEDLIRRVFQRYAFSRTPRVTDGRSRRRGGGSLSEIKLPRHARRTWYVLHECAHGIAQAFDNSEPWHGKTFVRVYQDLLTMFCDLPASSVRASMVKARLKRAQASKCAPPPARVAEKMQQAAAKVAKTKKAYDAALAEFNSMRERILNQRRER